MRIATAGIHTESSTFSPLPTRLDDFRILRGQELPADPHFRALAELADFEVIPLVHARALPGGPVTAAAYELLRSEFLEGLRAALPLDGLYLAMHGAMNVSGLDDAEGDWISAAREVVGPDCIIVASYDLHGNVSERIARNLDGLAAYRTAPHIDVQETHLRAVRMLRRALQTGVRPVLGRVPVPVLLPGERTSTEDEPARRLYAALPGFDARPGIWDANLLVGYVWADEPRSTASAVVTGDDAAEVRRTAEEIARSWWEARHEFSFGPRHGSLEGCLKAALAEAGPAGGDRIGIVADSGDNPTAGGVGDRADALISLLQLQAEGVLMAGIAAPDAVELAFSAGEGAERELPVGAQLAAESGPRTTVSARVKKLIPATDPRDREAVIETGGITAVLGARRRPYHHLHDLERVGESLADYRVLVVKSGYLSPELAPLAEPSLLALSGGAVSQDLHSLGHKRVPRPFFPRDENFDWEAGQS